MLLLQSSKLSTPLFPFAKNSATIYMSEWFSDCMFAGSNTERFLSYTIHRPDTTVLLYKFAISLDLQQQSPNTTIDQITPTS